MNQSERKKQTHLRCERQRREAINSGYNDLKDLLPANASFVGCKTTNAAILFRAADYVNQLNDEVKKTDEELTKMQTQLSALELIAKQYENFSVGTQADSPVQVEILEKFLDSTFDSFRTILDTTDYQSITRTLLQWIETADLKKPVDLMISTVESRPKS